MTRFDQIEHACLTDVGVRCSHNQDSLAIRLARDEENWRQRGHLFLVADGLGDHGGGEKASEQASQIIPHIYQKHAPQGPPQALRRAFVEANASIHDGAQKDGVFEGMGTTSTALLLRPDGAWVGHVGDSRCYRIRDEVIEQLSYDHSLVWEFARQWHIDPDAVEVIPANVIHRCLGPEPLVEVDVEGPHAILPGDVYLLCSDGLSWQATDEELGAVASVLPPAEACRFLVELSNLLLPTANRTRISTGARERNNEPTVQCEMSDHKTERLQDSSVGRIRGVRFLPTQPWMLQFGGDHLDLNVTLVGKDAELLTPTHTGTQPDAFTRNGKNVRRLGAWVTMLPDAAAARRQVGIKAKLDDTSSAWCGPMAAGSAAYYRIQGPTVVIEYAPQGTPTTSIRSSANPSTTTVRS